MTVACGRFSFRDLAAGAVYKYELTGPDGRLLPLKADPFGFEAELRPSTASVVADSSDFAWSDADYMSKRAQGEPRRKPMSIYEVHLGSWRRHLDGTFLTYDELADQLIPYVTDLGYTHLELLPISEHPLDDSWGYQPIGLFAPTRRFGEPAAFARFVDRAHAAGLGVILDWVPAHFPTDEHGLARFDGTALYEHADPRRGFHPDWNTAIYNFGRHEVANFLICNALYWLDRFHIDGLRVDAVASMLYLDYSRREGEWLPNADGSKENLEAIAFLRRVNELVYGDFPGAMTIAEELTAWPGVSRPTDVGGLGFGFKWNMGWMHDTLDYMSRDPIYRRWSHDKMTFGLLYAFSENFVLPLSHDEVVHGKGSVVGKMPGDDWQKLRQRCGPSTGSCGATRARSSCSWGRSSGRRWSGTLAQSLPWWLLDHWPHQGVQSLIRDLNHAYRETPALFARDCEPEGFRGSSSTTTHSPCSPSCAAAPQSDPPVADCLQLHAGAAHELSRRVAVRGPLAGGDQYRRFRIRRIEHGQLRRRGRRTPSLAWLSRIGDARFAAARDLVSRFQPARRRRGRRVTRRSTCPGHDRRRRWGSRRPDSRHAMAYVLAGGRGSRLMELTDRRAKPAVYFGGKSRIIDFRPVQRAELRHSAHRRRDAVQGAQPNSPSAAGMELLSAGTKRELRYPARFSQRVSETMWYLGTADAVYQNIDIIESYGPHFMVVLAGDHVYKMDYEQMLQQHVDSAPM